MGEEGGVRAGEEKIVLRRVLSPKPEKKLYRKRGKRGLQIIPSGFGIAIVNLCAFLKGEDRRFLYDGGTQDRKEDRDDRGGESKALRSSTKKESNFGMGRSQRNLEHGGGKENPRKNSERRKPKKVTV